MELAETLPWLVPGTVIALLVSLVASGAVAQGLRAHRITAWLLLFAFGVILAGTLSPLRDGGLPPGLARTCDLTRQWLATPVDLLLENDVPINILMFMPLGFAVGAIPLSFRKVGVVVGAFALPLTIESLQLLVVPLGRGCQSADVVDNLTGLFIGLVAGTPVSWLVPRRPTSGATSRPRRPA